MLSACKEKKQSEDIITTRYVPQHLEGPIAMAADSEMVNITWLNKPYTVRIIRTPMDSVQVSDDSGQKYVDNRVSMTIIRQDGSTFLDKMFTKKSFLSYIQEPFVKSGILAGIRFDEVDGSKLKFSVVVSMPDAVDDLFLPLIMAIDGDGGMSIRKDDDMGMLDYEEGDEE